MLNVLCGLLFVFEWFTDAMRCFAKCSMWFADVVIATIVFVAKGSGCFVAPIFAIVVVVH